MNTTLRNKLIHTIILGATTGLICFAGARGDASGALQNMTAEVSADDASASLAAAIAALPTGNVSATDADALGAAATGNETGATGSDIGVTNDAAAGAPSDGTDTAPAIGDASANDAEEEDNEYANFAIAQVTGYVNVRSGAGTSFEIVGKMYDGSVAEILETVISEEDGEEWYKIQSGNVEGYIKAEFFAAKEDALAILDQYITNYATVTATRLNVRSEADIESERIGYLDNNEKVKLVENLGEWMKVQYTDEKTGYVSAEYVTLSEEYITAKSLEEEAEELARARELQARQQAEEASTQEDVTIVVQQPDTTYTTNTELRQAIIDYAMQFLGNKYVHGGQSLTTGTDCSGFTCYVLKEFGYSISRTPSGQLSSAGRLISTAEMQPGDIICYGKSSCTHVAFYIGNGQILHAANSRKGVIIGDAYYNNILGVKNVID